MATKRGKLPRRVRVDPAVLGGKPVIRGTRISVEVVLECLAEGVSVEQICEDYGVTPADIRAAARYAHSILSGEEASSLESLRS